MADANPIILSAVFIPNPADVGESILLQVLAVDVETVEQDEIRMSGEFNSGEV